MGLQLESDLADLLQAIVDIESVSGNEGPLADQVEAALAAYDHLRVSRHGDTVVARTELGRDERVVIAGHLDTVPVAANLPSARATVNGAEVITGRGTCDMKGGVAVQLSAAAALTAPNRDITWIFYDNEEVAASKNGLGRLARERPDLLQAEFAILGEPSNASIEAGCQGTMRVELTTKGVAAHSARSWLGHNAIHDLARALQVVSDYEPRQPEVDGLRYHEGLNAVQIGGGIAGNVVPDRAQVSINYRFAPDRSPAEAEAHLRELFDGYELAVTDSSPGARPGLGLPAARDFLAAVGGEPSPKFGWTDVSRFSAMGVAAVNFGPGDPRKAHTDDEFCPVADLHTCHQGLLRWLG